MTGQRRPRVAGTAVRLIGLIAMLSCVIAHGQSPSDASARTERVRHAVNSVRFVAYTPTDLRIDAGQVHPASRAGIRRDLVTLRHDFDGLVTYSCADGLELVPGIAQSLGYRALIVGIWDPLSQQEIDNAIHVARAWPDLVIGVVVGNETLFARRLEWPVLRAAMTRLRAQLPEVAITTSEPFHVYLDHDPPDFVERQDFLLPNVHPLYQPWFAPDHIAQSIEFVLQVTQRLSVLSDKPLLIKETGLPSGPETAGFTPQRQAQFWSELAQRWPREPGRGLGYFEAFDHAWKAENARREFGFHPEETHWGLYREDGKPKPVMQALRAVWTRQERHTSP